jgi:hypothetical protein
MENFLKLIRLLKEAIGVQLRLDDTEFNHVSISSDCARLKGYYADNTLYLDREDCYDKSGNCPIRFRCADVHIADKTNPLVYQVKHLLSIEAFKFSNKFGYFWE